MLNLSTFLSYLWGMETWQHFAYPSAMFNHVLILPMRNGNSGKCMPSSGIWIPRSYPTYEEWKLCILKLWWFRQSCSYPTYEEWKRKCGCKYVRKVIECSYPTYEEWKRIDIIEEYQQKLSSYPTYEEWKLYKFPYTHIWVSSSYPTYEEWKL